MTIGTDLPGPLSLDSSLFYVILSILVNVYALLYIDFSNGWASNMSRGDERGVSDMPIPFVI
jgi:hypothetical protein